MRKGNESSVGSAVPLCDAARGERAARNGGPKPPSEALGVDWPLRLLWLAHRLEEVPTRAADGLAVRAERRVGERKRQVPSGGEEANRSIDAKLARRNVVVASNQAARHELGIVAEEVVHHDIEAVIGVEVHKGERFIRKV
eukprot:2612876-Prymnesium_polylepis.3